MTGEVRVRAREEERIKDGSQPVSQQHQCLPFQLQLEWIELQGSGVPGLQQTKDVHLEGSA
eukprot:12924087-Prorocentrum_lima.AAC.1